MLKEVINGRSTSSSTGLQSTPTSPKRAYRYDGARSKLESDPQREGAALRLFFWMPHRPRLRQMPRLWRIDRVSDETTEYVGVVTASDKDAAIKQACEKFGIVDPERQGQLVARKV